jgi:hypothetical protein
VASKPPATELLDVVREFMGRDLLAAISPERAEALFGAEAHPPSPREPGPWASGLGLQASDPGLRALDPGFQAPRGIDLWFQCKIAINLLGIAGRELELRQQFETAERLRLIDLLGKSGSLDSLNRELCQLIRNGALRDDSPELIRHLRASLTEALRINNPKWLDEPVTLSDLGPNPARS